MSIILQTGGAGGGGGGGGGIELLSQYLSTNANTASLTITFAASGNIGDPDAGDFLLLFAFTPANSGEDIAVPSGWTEEFVHVHNGGYYHVFSLVAAGTETSVLLDGASTEYAYSLYRFTGVDQTTPIDATITESGTGATKTPTGIGITTATDGAFVVAADGGRHTWSSPTLTNTGWNWKAGVRANAAIISGCVKQATAGASEVPTFSVSNPAEAVHQQITVAIRPAS